MVAPFIFLSTARTYKVLQVVSELSLLLQLMIPPKAIQILTNALIFKFLVFGNLSSDKLIDKYTYIKITLG